MLFTLTLLAVTAVAAPPVWFAWWLLADWAESVRSRRQSLVPVSPRSPGMTCIGEDRYDRAA